MLFGHSVHTALEALHQGHRGTCPVPGGDEDDFVAARRAYGREFDAMSARLSEQGIVASANLYSEGLKMLALVADLELNADRQSQPEHWFSLPTKSWGMPTIGAVDLWSPPWSKHGPVVWDFKTTVGGWSQARAERERWQPMLYTWAYRRAYGVLPVFRYVVLSRTSGTLQTFDRRWMTGEWRDDFLALHVHAEEISEAVQDGAFDCTRGHGTCLECGRPYGHDHVCDEASRPRKVKLVRKHGQTWVQPELDLF